MAKHSFCFLKGYNSSPILPVLCNGQKIQRQTDKTQTKMDRYIRNNPTVSFDECDQDRYVTVIKCHDVRQVKLEPVVCIPGGLIMSRQ